MSSKLDEALVTVIHAVKADQRSEFAQKALLGILGLLKAVPELPGLEVMSVIARLCVVVTIDCVLVNQKGEILFTEREDPYFKGWHIPGFVMRPRCPILTQIRLNAEREFGPGVEIIGAEPVEFFNNDDCSRNHHAAWLMLCDFGGSPSIGKWFPGMPKDIIPIHRKYQSALIRAADQHERREASRAAGL